MSVKSIVKQFSGVESAEGDIPADAWATAIIKVAVILVVGVVILNGVVGGANMSNTSPFYALYTNVVANINSGYTLAALMVLAIGAGAIMHFLGFM
jgi:hypothetical protein